MIYLDNSATTKPCQTAVKNINTCLESSWGNPSSLYKFGADAEAIISKTREQIAELINCRDDEIFFTSGGTESNNLALLGGAEAMKRRGKRIVTTSVEHPSVLNTCNKLSDLGFEVIKLKPESDGSISTEKVLSAVNEDTVLVSMMLVNNETGCIFPVKEVVDRISASGLKPLIHCDAVQAFGKLPIDVEALGVDLLSASGHKIHASKGIGFLYKSKRINLKPILFGGGQESGLRSGTEAVPLISGLSGAINELDIITNYNKVKSIYDYAVKKFSELDFVVINSPLNGTLPYILNISIPGYRSETLLHYLEEREIYVSSGSACSKGKGSHVLNEMGISRSIIDSALRISFSRYNDKFEVDALCDALKSAVTTLRKSK